MMKMAQISGNLFLFQSVEERHRHGQAQAQAKKADAKRRVTLFKGYMQEIFAANSAKKPPVVHTNALIGAADHMYAKQFGPEAYLPPIDRAGTTFVIKDERAHKGHAIIVSYDHHLIDMLKAIIVSLDGGFRSPHKPSLTPRVDYCANLYARGHLTGPDGITRLVDQPSGRMLVVSDFARLDLEAIRGRNDLPGGACMRELYVEIARQLKMPAAEYRLARTAGCAPL